MRAGGILICLVMSGWIFILELMRPQTPSYRSVTPNHVLADHKLPNSHQQPVRPLTPNDPEPMPPDVLRGADHFFRNGTFSATATLGLRLSAGVSSWHKADDWPSSPRQQGRGDEKYETR